MVCSFRSKKKKLHQLPATGPVPPPTASTTNDTTESSTAVTSCTTNTIQDCTLKGGDTEDEEDAGKTRADIYARLDKARAAVRETARLPHAYDDPKAASGQHASRVAELRQKIAEGQRLYAYYNDPVLKLRVKVVIQQLTSRLEAMGEMANQVRRKITFEENYWESPYWLTMIE